MLCTEKKRVVYRKNLSISTDNGAKTVKTLIRLLPEEQSDQGLYCLSFYLLHEHIILHQNLKLFNFSIFSILISGVRILRGFHLKNVCWQPLSAENDYSGQLQLE